MNEIIFEILKVVVMVAAVVIVRYIVPYLKSAAETSQLKTVTEWVQNAVMYAQQVMQTSTGAEKKAAVVDILHEALTSAKITITEDQLNVLIESAVKAMKMTEAEKNITITPTEVTDAEAIQDAETTADTGEN